MATKKQKELGFKIGAGLGNVMFDIALEHITSGDPEGAIDVYVRGLHGMTRELALGLLKQDYVLYTSADDQVSLTDEDEIIKKQRELGLIDFDYTDFISRKLLFIDDCVKSAWHHRNICNERYSAYTENLSELNVHNVPEKEYRDTSLNNLCARVIADNPFDTSLVGNGERVWEMMCSRVEAAEGDRKNPVRGEQFLYHLSMFVKNIRILLKEYLAFYKTYEFLVENDFIKKPVAIEYTMEKAFHLLSAFAENANYSHPMCNNSINELKDKIKKSIPLSKLGDEFVKNGIIAKDIRDCYDAGYLGPDGTFYGADGPDNAMIHMNLAEDLFNGLFNEQMKKAGVCFNGSGTLDPEYWLMAHGFMKVHHNEIYGFFRTYKDDNDDDRILFAPTDTQIKLICEYADKRWNGCIYTQPKIVTKTEPIKTSKLRQMDEIALHGLFCRY